MDLETKIATWGYKPDGKARIFDLALGEALPEGWNASPDCITDPTLASADALSAAAAGRAYQPPRAEPTAAPASAEAAMVEIERLKGMIEAGMAENQRLFEDLDAAEAVRDAALADAATARTAHERATAQLTTAATDLDALRAALASAQVDGGFAVAERDEANAHIDALTADLAKAKADLDEMLTAPPAKPTSKAK